MAADIDKRTRYFDGQLLRQEDFNDEQAYHLDRTRRHNRQFLAPGIAEGLQVTGVVGATEVEVDPGTAVDGEGRQIVLAEKRTLPIDEALAGSVLVVISYAEVASDLSVVGARGETRWHERPEVEIVPETGAPPEDTHVRLARFSAAAGSVDAPLDLSVRVAAGAQLGDEVTARKLTLRREADAASLWPALSSGATSRLDVAGALHVGGDLSLTGQVDGREVAADGGNLDAHLANTGNPHAVTAAQLGAPVSIDGVSNPGGNIDLAVSGAITLAPDDGQNRVTIGENHSPRTDNPHAVTAAQLGALLASDYDLSQRAFAYVYFSHSNADGATASVNLGFQPKFVWVSGSVYAYMNGGYQGGTTMGFADVKGEISQRVVTVKAYRLTGIPYVRNYSSYSSSYVVYGYFYDYSMDPNGYETVGIKIDSVDTDGLTFSFYRPSHSSYTSMSVYIRAYAACFG